MSVTFKSKQAQLAVAHDTIFHIGVVIPPRKVDQVLKIGVSGDIANLGARVVNDPVDYEVLERAGIPDPHMVNASYIFNEGVNHNQLTLTREDAIEGMRAYIQRRGDNLIVELDEDGNEPAEPEGTPFVAKRDGFVLYPAMYKGRTTADGKTFYFNMGAEDNKYITTDPEEIAIIRGYIRSHANCGISDPTYKDPLAEE